MTQSVLLTPRSVPDFEPTAGVNLHRDSAWHDLVARLLVAALTMSALIVQVSGSASALSGSQDAPTSPVRSIDLGSDTFNQVLVSAPEQRIVVSGSESLSLYDLATMQLITTVDFEDSNRSTRMYGDSVYVFEPGQQAIVQIRLSDGGIARQWEADARMSRIVAVSPSYIWYETHEPGISEHYLCRIAHNDSGTGCFLQSERHAFGSVSSIDASEETVLARSPQGWYTRLHLTGSEVVPQNQAWPVDHYGDLLDLEPAENYSLWTRTWTGLTNVSRSTLVPSVVMYDSGTVRSVIVEPLDGQYAAVETAVGDDVIVLYRSGDATPVARFHPGRTSGERHDSIALTKTELVQLTSTRGNDRLNTYTIPAPAETQAAPGRQLVPHDGVRSLAGLGLQDVALLEVFAEQDRLVVGGGDELFIYRLSDLSLVAQHTDMDGLIQATASSESLFVLARGSSEVVELRFDDGVVVNQWRVPVLGTTGLAVTADAVWLSVVLDTPATELGRLDRASGQFELVAVEGAFGSIRTLQGLPGTGDVVLAAMGSTVEIISLEGAPRTVQTSQRSSDHLAWGRNGGAAYRVQYDQVVVFGPATDVHKTDGIGPHIDFLASNASGSEFVVGTSRGSIAVFEHGSLAPINRFETWDSLHQLAMSDSELVTVAGELGDLTVTVRPHAWTGSNNELEITLLGHGSVILDPGPVRLECREEEFHEMQYGSTRTFSIDPQHRYCSVRPMNSGGADETIAAIWTNGHWEIQEQREVRVDLHEVSRVLFIDYLPSPLNDDHRFVDQAYLDITGTAPSRDIGQNIAQLLRKNEITELDLIAYLIYEEAGYESSHAPISRLYRAYFLRNPDLAGHQFWVERNQEGQGVRSISEFFATSPEFRQRYGSLSDAEFVRLVYANVMERRPDEGGRSFWMDRLANGLSRGEMMTLFSDSPEFRTRADGDVFVTYMSGALERRELSSGEHAQRMRIYQQQGPGAVVLDILNGATYFDRFWVEGATSQVVSNAMLSVVADDANPEQFVLPETRSVGTEAAVGLVLSGFARSRGR